jgi:hypothetical protein
MSPARQPRGQQNQLALAAADHEVASEEEDFHGIPVSSIGPRLVERRPIGATRDGTVNPIRTLARSTTGDLLSFAPRLEHDPEKWIPVFGKDHAPPIS